MRAPDFWWEPGTGLLLSPLGALYGAVAWTRMRGEGRQAGVPVICLGNLTVGGAGKTPAALAAARVLLAAHERPFFLTRGYGGRLAGPVRVNPALHTAAHVGDEPLLLARLAPTIVARDRVAGARAARANGASVVVMDDGFQNPSLVKDLAIVLVDGTRGIGNGRVIPAGPLRAPLTSQIDHAQAVLVVGPRDGAEPVIELAQSLGKTVLHGSLEPDRSCLAALAGRQVLAFAGIGNPEKFYATLEDAGITIAHRASFPDHHRYTASEARALVALAREARLVLVTTEKDLVRLAGDQRLTELAAHATALPVRLVIDERDAFSRLILGALNPGSGYALRP